MPPPQRELEAVAEWAAQHGLDKVLARLLPREAVPADAKRRFCAFRVRKWLAEQPPPNDAQTFAGLRARLGDLRRVCGSELSDEVNSAIGEALKYATAFIPEEFDVLSAMNEFLPQDGKGDNVELRMVRDACLKLHEEAQKSDDQRGYVLDKIPWSKVVESWEEVLEQAFEHHGMEKRTLIERMMEEQEQCEPDRDGDEERPAKKKKGWMRWEEWEVENLKNGVAAHPRNMRAVLDNFEFKAGRTTVQLTDKFRMMKRKR